MGNVFYFIKTLKCIFGRKGLQKILLILVVFVGLFFILHTKGYCVDELQEVSGRYDSVVNDFITSYQRADDSEAKTNLLSFLNSTNFNYYIYGSNTSTDNVGNYMFQASIPTMTYFYVFAYDKNYVEINPTALEDSYLGTGVSIDRIRSSRAFIFRIHNNIVEQISFINTWVYLPRNLVNFRSYRIQQFLTEYQNYLEQKKQTETLEETKDFLQDSTLNNDSINIDTSITDSIDSTQTQGLFTTIFNSFNSAINTEGVETLYIPLTPTDKSITIRSDIVSSHLGNLAFLISAFWYYIFGMYAFKFVNNLIVSIKSGDILNGVSSSSEVITSEMM